jgi:chaperonin GroES
MSMIAGTPGQIQPGQGDPYGMPASDYPLQGGAVQQQAQPDPAMLAQQAAEQEQALQLAKEQAARAEAEREVEKDRLSAQIEMLNIAEHLDHNLLVTIGYRVVEDFEIDRESRSEWKTRNDLSLRMAQLIYAKDGQESFVADVKYPALAMAAIQFHARAYPNIVKGRDVVKCRVVGKDPDQAKCKRGDRVQQHMSFQVLEQMEGWEEDTDQLLMTLPIVGCAFRKTYRDTLDSRNASEMVPADNLYIPYFAKTLEKAPRITEWIDTITPNMIVERVRSGQWIDFRPGEAVTVKEGEEDKQNSQDKDQPHVFLEQHRWWDLDGDGYQEPYIITVHLDTKQVVRITARYDSDGVQRNERGEVIRITPVHFYTRYLFLPAFDGGVYGMGFGELIGRLNQIINTTCNQLLDAGALQNGPPGLIGKGAKSVNKDRMLRLKPRQWYYVDITGDDIRKSLVPLPVGAPSDVLFKLLGMLVEVSKEIASNVDLLGGNQPQANVPATTTLALIEQGLKVFSDIYKRVHRSLKSEFKKIVRLNKLYLTEEEYQEVVEDPDAKLSDYYDKDLHIVPISDEADLTDMQRITKAQALKETMGEGANDQEILRRYYEALEIDDIDKLLPQGAPPPNPEVQIKQAELELKQTELEIKKLEVQLKQAEAQSKSRKTESEANLIDAKTQTEQLMQQISALQLQAEQDQQRIAELEALSRIHDRNNQTALDAADMVHKHAIDRHQAALDVHQAAINEHGAGLDEQRLDLDRQAREAAAKQTAQQPTQGAAE